MHIVGSKRPLHEFISTIATVLVRLQQISFCKSQNLQMMNQEQFTFWICHFTAVQSCFCPYRLFSGLLSSLRDLRSHNLCIFSFRGSWLVSLEFLLLLMSLLIVLSPQRKESTSIRQLTERFDSYIFESAVVAESIEHNFLISLQLLLEPRERKEKGQLASLWTSFIFIIFMSV